MIRRVGLLVLLVLLLAPAGAPIQLSYVYSDSMEPTIGVDDGYVVVPAGEVKSGDVVTFWSPERDAHVTHRIVGKTDAGFITKGDNNPTTDQAAGYPPVTREQIRGAVLSFGGEPLVVPYLGAGIALLREHLLALVAVVLGALGLRWLAGGGSHLSREVSRVGDISTPTFLIGLLVLTGVLATGGVTHEVTLVAVEPTSGVDASGTATVGQSEPLELRVLTPETALTTRTVSTDGLTEATATYDAESVTIAGTVPAPATIGPVPVLVSVHRYPAVLPRPVIDRLHELHPFAAAGATATAVIAPLWLVFRLLVDTAEALRASRSRWWRILTGEIE